MAGTVMHECFYRVSKLTSDDLCQQTQWIPAGNAAILIMACKRGVRHPQVPAADTIRTWACLLPGQIENCCQKRAGMTCKRPFFKIH